MTNTNLSKLDLLFLEIEKRNQAHSENSVKILQINRTELIEVFSECVKLILKDSDNNNAESNSDYLSMDEAAKLLRLSRQTLYEMRRKGKIQSYKIGHKVLFNKSEILELIK